MYTGRRMSYTIRHRITRTMVSVLAVAAIGGIVIFRRSRKQDGQDKH